MTTTATYTQLGFGNAVPTATVPFSGKGNTTQIVAKTVAEGGNGNQVNKFSKEALANTVSHQFLTNNSPRVEFGLLGDDNFGIKTSSDGTNWKTAFVVDKTTGVITTPYGTNIAPATGSVNDVIKFNNAKFVHLPQAINTVGLNTFIGLASGSTSLVFSDFAYSASFNTCLGAYSMSALTSGFANCALGYNTLNILNTGVFNTAIGSDSLSNLIVGNYNTAVGKGALLKNTANSNTAVGIESNFNLITGTLNTSLGAWSGYSNISGSENTALGVNALRWKQDGTDNTGFDNCTGIGFDSRVSGSNQVQLGNSSTTTYAYGAVQNRSDARDKADVRDTLLGLDFINALRPVDYKWDMRDDYFEEEITIGENGEEIKRLNPIPKDGSKKRTRYHQGLIAQEVKEVCDNLGIDFGGYQDHSINGGADVLSLGYTELIAPLIKAVQELSVENQSLKIRIEALENK